MTYVTCPTRRYHPAVVAQKAATMALLSDGRFRLGLGAGESLNEHVVGEVAERHDAGTRCSSEAVDVIRALWEGSADGRYTSWHGKHFEVDSARIFDMPEELPEIGVAVSGPRVVLARRPQGRHRHHGRARRRTWWRCSPRRAEPASRSSGRAAAATARTPASSCSSRTSSSGGSVPGGRSTRTCRAPVAFDAATQFVREEDLAPQIPHGPEVEPYVQAVKGFADAGFTHFAFVQIGPDQRQFCEWYASELKPALAGI